MFKRMLNSVKKKVRQVVSLAAPTRMKTPTEIIREEYQQRNTCRRYGYPQSRKINQRQARKRAKW